MKIRKWIEENILGLPKEKENKKEMTEKFGRYKIFKVKYRKKGKPDERFVFAKNGKQAEELVRKHHGEVEFDGIFIIDVLSPWRPFDHDINLDEIYKKAVQEYLEQHIKRAVQGLKEDIRKTKSEAERNLREERIKGDDVAMLYFYDGEKRAIQKMEDIIEKWFPM